MDTRKAAGILGPGRPSSKHPGRAWEETRHGGETIALAWQSAAVAGDTINEKDGGPLMCGAATIARRDDSQRAKVATAKPKPAGNALRSRVRHSPCTNLCRAAKNSCG